MRPWKITMEGGGNTVSLRKILQKKYIISNTEIGQADLVIIDHVIPEYSGKIPAFVKDGGICWITHQDDTFDTKKILQSELSAVKIVEKYKSVNGFEMEYIGPWITQRMHPLWHNPHYVDEGDFVFWDFKLNKENYRTAATHILFPQSKKWDIIAGFADYDVRLKDGAAMIMTARYGKGLYLWTQIMCPDSQRNKNKFAIDGWNKLVDNVLDYFENFAEDSELKLFIEPWAIKSGESVALALTHDKKSAIEKVSCPLVKFTKEKDGKYAAIYRPEKTGTIKLKVDIWFKNGKKTSRYGFVKVSGENTPFKFFTHTHYGNCYAPESLGVINGACRKLNIDGVILSGGLFHKEDNKYQAIDDSDIKMADNPLVRFFPGEEIHCMHQYSEKEGTRDDNPDRRRHASTIGCWNLYPYENDKWVPENLEKIHAAKGLAVVCHPYMDGWWLSPQNGHDFEAVEFDRCDTSLWDKAISEGELVTGLSGIDNAAGLQWLPLRGANTGWFDEPFTLEGIFRTVLKGKITKFNSYPLPFNATDSYLWFDVNSLPGGGTLYAVDSVDIHVKIKSHLPMQQIYIVKNGKRNYKNIEPNREDVDLHVADVVESDGYYRVEANHDKLYAPYCVGSLSNPVFVKKVNGPSGGYFFFINNAEPVFDEHKKRWRMPRTVVTGISFKDNIWEIHIHEPAEMCRFYCHKRAAIRIDGKECKESNPVFGQGEHIILLQQLNKSGIRY